MEMITEQLTPTERQLLLYGEEILRSPGMQKEHDYIQHGRITVFEHSLGVAYMSLRIARRLKLHVDERALIRGALLHDYFLYDWHIKEDYHRWHGFCHPEIALRNAGEDFELGEIEQDIIGKHMFPLTFRSVPRFRESMLVCLVDKLCACLEIISLSYINERIKYAAGCRLNQG